MHDSFLVVDFAFKLINVGNAIGKQKLTIK